MRVFKACILIMKRHIGALLIYLFVFMGLAVVIAKMNENTYTPDFETERPTFAVINRDGESPLYESMLTYLADYGTLVTLEDDKEVLQDASFFHAAEVIFIIPDGFIKSLESGNAASIETMARHDSTYSYYLTSFVDQYWNLVEKYGKLMPDMEDEDIARTVIADLSVHGEVEKKQFMESSPLPNAYIIFCQIQPYILLVLIILCTSTIFMAFRHSDLHMRNLCSPMRSGSMSLALMAYAGIITVVVWLLLNLIGLVWCHEALAAVDRRIIGLILMNSLCYSLVSMTLALTVSLFINSEDAQNSVANFLSLGMSFLGGVFVPQEMLGEKVLAVGRFTPTYWYISALTRICSLNTFDSEAMAPIWQGLLIQAAFLVALFCVFLAVNKYKNKAEQSFGSVKTQIES